MAQQVLSTLDFNNATRITNLPAAVGSGEPITKATFDAYVVSAAAGIAWKDSVRVSTQSNISLASPGATIDGITMALNDRVLVRNQTTTSENGIYIWNGASTAMTRSSDAATYNDLEQARVSIEEGTDANSLFIQTGVNGTIGSTAVTWTSSGTSAPAATTTTAGIAALATPAEVAAGVVANKIVTPSGLAGSGLLPKRFTQVFGDGSATSFTFTHNFNTRDVQVTVYRNSGNYDEVLVESRRSTVNTVQVLFDTAPSTNGFNVVITA